MTCSHRAACTKMANAPALWRNSRRDLRDALTGRAKPLDALQLTTSVSQHACRDLSTLRGHWRLETFGPSEHAQAICPIFRGYTSGRHKECLGCGKGRLLSHRMPWRRAAVCKLLLVADVS